MERLLSEHWHELDADEVARLLDADLEAGLDRFEVSDRQERFGPNRLTGRRAESRLMLFLRQLHQPLVYILLAATVITAILNEWVDASVIFGVVIVNAVVGYLQESKARRAIEALANAMTVDATVIRAGERQRVPATELVPGDLVLLGSGDRVPADARLVRSRELQVDESSLTGESVPSQKGTAPLDVKTPLADRENMVYSSTLVTYGTGAGVVVATGDRSEIGRINELISTAEMLATPLTRRIATFSHWLLYAILGLSTITFAVGAFRGEPLVDMFMAAVALAVGAIPEGLPAALTITLAIGVSKMARRNAIIRRLPAVETLGSTTVICSDKTGTLTQNQMTVQRLALVDREYAVTGGGYEPRGAILEGDAPVDVAVEPRLRELLVAGEACNDARLRTGGDTTRVEGDPTEAALLVAARKADLPGDAAPPRIDTLPFESEHQYMATLHGAPESGRVVYLKGSVERVLDRCEGVWSPDGQRPLDADAVHRRAEALAGEGLRVLAFARKSLPADADGVDHADVASGLELLGLQAMIDPPRPEAEAAVAACRRAGIRVKMITGDHARTAVAIAERLGLDGAVDADGRLAASTGAELAELTDDELIEHAHRTAVFARVAPEQKLRLVEALQAPHVHGHVVAMTGDGVNDAPALRRADIGVAMGLSGTEVAKEAADMVLADDNFSSIESAVEEGRGVYGNLVKFITWTLPTNLGEGLVIFVAVLAGLRMPITPVQILWINMTTAVLMGMMLAFEPKEPGMMTRPPRDPRAPILTRPLVGRILLVGLMLLLGAFGLYELAIIQGRPVAVARTMAVNVFVFGEMFYLFNCRSLTQSMFRLGLVSNPWLLAGVATMAALQVAFTYAPPLHVAFDTAAIGAIEWLWVLGVGLAIYVVVGLEKWVGRRWSGGSRDPVRRRRGDSSETVPSAG
ncbi:MAG TPA: cation-transporting P-type ATPase [Sandaracinaceae bacterium LLY-WYZ-13_1]|nr:cation-transporting P-type ATPase [Sandaracinaceae bacterium LLY-WYZ-13_1]